MPRPASWMISSARRSCEPQSQRRHWNTSPKRHSECIRTSTGPPQDAARHRAQRQDVTGAREIFGAAVRVHHRANGDGAVVGRRARRHTTPGVHRDGERSAEWRRVVGHHHGDLQLVEPLTGHGHADQPPPVLGHEVDGLGRRFVGRHEQVALVLTVLVVGDQEHPALPDLLDGLFDTREPAHDDPRNASERTTYLPITSASMLTGCPTRSRPSVVAASVCGINITSNAAASSAATVRLTPSTATEPFGTISAANSGSGNAIRTRAVDSTRDTSVTVATPSTWPRTRCPPRAAPNRRGRSRFTKAPARRWPRVVRSRVSGPTSKASVVASRVTTVRQAPFTAMLAPPSLPSRAIRARTVRRRVEPSLVTATISPTSSTMPVNIIRRGRGRPRSGDRRRWRAR